MWHNEPSLALISVLIRGGFKRVSSVHLNKQAVLLADRLRSELVKESMQSMH